MSRFFLSFDAHNATPETYDEIKRILNKNFTQVKDGQEESTFCFDGEEPHVELVRRRLECLFAPPLNITFTVIDLENGNKAQGESYNAIFDRLVKADGKGDCPEG